MKTFLKNNQLLLNPFHPDTEMFAARYVFFASDVKGTTSSSGKGAKGGTRTPESREPAEPDETTAPVESKEAAPEVTENVEIGESVPHVRSSIARSIDAVIGTSVEALKASKENAGNPEVTRNLTKILEDLRNLRGAMDESQKKLRGAINKLLDKKAIDAKNAQDILDLKVSLPDYETGLQKLTGPLKKTLGDSEFQTLIDAKKEEASRYPKIKEEFEHITQRLQESLEGVQKDFFREAYRQRSLEEHGRQLGFELKPGKVLRFKFKRPVIRPAKDANGNPVKNEKGEPQYEQVLDSNGNAVFEPIYRKAVIKEINYKDTVTSDAKGNTVKIPTMSPRIVLEIEDEWPDKNGITDKYTPEVTVERLHEIVDMQDMAEYMPEKGSLTEDLKQAEALLGEKIATGAGFTYREMSLKDNKLTGEDKTVAIKNITLENDDFFESDESAKKGTKQVMIELDHEVVTALYPQQLKSNKLSLPQFIRWYRRLHAAPEQKISIEQLKKQLVEENNARNQKYQRNENEYPPIELKEGEMLYYETVPPSLFVIQKIADDKITLDNGSEYTPGSFLNWVKNNEVEKFTPDAEGAKAVRHMPAETEEEIAAKEAERSKAIKQAAESQEMRENPPEGFVLEKASSEESSPANANYLRNLWNQTYFLGLGNFYEIGKQIIEYIKRYMERREKETIGVVGAQALGSFLPQLGREFETIRQNAENENVNYYKGAYEQYGFGDLQGRLGLTKNSDELKAIFQVMSANGFINWSDPTLWAAVIRIAKRKNFDISKAKHNEDSIREIVDKLWGAGSFRSFKNENDSKYQSKVDENKKWAQRLENDPERAGGSKKRLQDYLYLHMKGEWVDPAIYEALLYFAIEAGKLSFADKIYFFVMGLGMEGTGPNQGKPLLDWYRLSAMEGNLLNKFPVLDYFTDFGLPLTDENGNPLWDPKTGRQKRGQATISEVKGIINKYIKKDAGRELTNIKDPKDFSPGAALNDFIEREMILNNNVVVRLTEKASRDVENWDHDDMHIFGSQLKEEQVQQIAMKSGAKQLVSIAGVKNTFAGLNHFTKRYMDQFIASAKVGNEEGAEKNLRRFTDTVRSFIRLDAIVDNRYHQHKHEFTRLANEKNSFAGVDSSRKRTVRESNQEINDFMQGLFERMRPHLGQRPYQELMKTWIIMQKQFGASQQQKIKEQTDAFNSFGSKLENAMGIVQDKIGVKGLGKIFDDIQNHSEGEGPMVKGIMQTTTSKEDLQAAEAAEQKSFQLARIKPGNLRDLASEYDRLVAEYEIERNRKPGEKEAAKKSKLNAVLEKIRGGQYDDISTEDESYLQKEVDNMRRALGVDSVSVPSATVDDSDLDLAA